MLGTTKIYQPYSFFFKVTWDKEKSHKFSFMGL